MTVYKLGPETMIFENRNKDLTNLHKAADYLGRALGENLKILSVDSKNDAVSFLSEGESIICCKYETLKGNLRLSEFVIESAKEALSPSKLDEEISEGIDSFLESLRESKFDTADTSFDDVLDLFDKRNSLGSYTATMSKHADSFGVATRIIESDEFKNLEELRPNLISFIKENLEDITNNRDIMDAMKINSAMSTAFKVNKLTMETLAESKHFNVDLSDKKSLYEMVCQQELVRQELVEAKSSMSNIWITNKNVQKLSSMIFSKDNNIKETLAETIDDVPYFAFATKSDINEMLTSLYEVNTTDVISNKDTKEFVSKIYEWKKPVKDELVKILDEKYGINVANLKFVPTFNNLAKSTSVMCEVISMLASSKSVISAPLKEFSSFLSKKGGVEVLDVTDYLSECMAAGGVEVIEENMLMNYIDMPRLAKDLMALKILIGADSAMGGEPGAEGMEGMEGEEEVPVEGGDDFGQEEQEMEGEEGNLQGDQNGEFGETDEVPGENGEFAPESEPQQGMDPSQHDVGAPDAGEGGQEGFPPGGGAEGEEQSLGDDSVENGEVPPQDGQAPPVPGAGGGMDSLVSDLEKLVAGMNVGGGGGMKPKPKFKPQRPAGPGDQQYEA